MSLPGFGVPPAIEDTPAWFSKVMGFPDDHRVRIVDAHNSLTRKRLVLEKWTPYKVGWGKRARIEHRWDLVDHMFLGSLWYREDLDKKGREWLFEINRQKRLQSEED